MTCDLQVNVKENEIDKHKGINPIYWARHHKDGKESGKERERERERERDPNGRKKGGREEGEKGKKEACDPSLTCVLLTTET